MSGPADGVSPWAETYLSLLDLPSPPGELAAQVVDLGEGRFGTRPDAPALRGLGWYAAEATQRRAGDYVLAGVEDVATGLAAVHYLVSNGPVAVLLQRIVVADDDGRFVFRAPGDAEVFRAAETLQREGQRLTHGTRLVVLDDAFATREWHLSSADARDADAARAGAAGAGDRTEGGGGVHGALAFIRGPSRDAFTWSPEKEGGRAE